MSTVAWQHCQVLLEAFVIVILFKFVHDCICCVVHKQIWKIWLAQLCYVFKPILKNFNGRILNIWGFCIICCARTIHLHLLICCFPPNSSVHLYLVALNRIISWQPKSWGRSCAQALKNNWSKKPTKCFIHISDTFAASVIMVYLS